MRSIAYFLAAMILLHWAPVAAQTAEPPALVASGSKAAIRPTPADLLTLASIWGRHDAIALSDIQLPQTHKLDGGSHEFIGRGGNRVCGWDLGEADRPVILWWTGGPGEPFGSDVPAWSSLDIQAYRHICIDTPGAGEDKLPKSEWRAGWRPEDQADDAATFLKARGIKRKVIVLGWSWGSTMALLFAQRHPDLCEGVVAGGVWANTPSEVRRYLGSASTRSWIPGANAPFERVVGRNASAARIYGAIRKGLGGKEFAQAYGLAEAGQARPDSSLRGQSGPVGVLALGDPSATPDSEDSMVRFALIESEMMARGEAKQWRLRFRFGPKLAQVPLILVQGRYDQVCDPEIARNVFAAWPGSKKLFVPMNIGHWNGGKATKAELAAVGIDPSTAAKLTKLNALHWGSASCMMAAGVDTIRDLKTKVD